MAVGPPHTTDKKNHVDTKLIVFDTCKIDAIFLFKYLYLCHESSI